MIAVLLQPLVPGVAIAWGGLTHLFARQNLDGDTGLGSDNFTMCDYTVAFDTLADLGLSIATGELTSPVTGSVHPKGTMRSDCVAAYALDALITMLDTAYNNYTVINDGYDKEFDFYITYMKKTVAWVLDNSFMFNTAAAFMIDGDFRLKYGTVTRMYIRGSDGLLHTEEILRYEASVTIASSRIVGSRTVDVVVYVPTKLFPDKPESAFANLHGRLYIPDFVNGNISDDILPKIAIIETVVAHRYTSNPEHNTLIMPTITLVGVVCSSTRFFGGDLIWRVLDVRSSTFVNGEEIPTKVT